jgi:PhzF family phenazine biosynthesis protein
MNQLFKVRAFTKDNQGGNKAGVYVFADDLTEKEMQQIAKNLGYSETAFVMKSKVADYKVRFFTPTKEVDLCGHATISVFHVLRTLDIIGDSIYTQETKAGILKINVILGQVYMQQLTPSYIEEVNQDIINKSFNDIEFHDTLKPYVVSTGLKEIFVPVKNKEILNKLTPNIDQMIKTSHDYQAIGMHVFALDNEVDAYCRNFAPVVGINEESATGTSNGALACYLHKFYKKKHFYTLRQGYSMDEPSELKAYIDFKSSKITDVWIGGISIIIT